MSTYILYSAKQIHNYIKVDLRKYQNSNPPKNEKVLKQHAVWLKKDIDCM